MMALGTVGMCYRTKSPQQPLRLRAEIQPLLGKSEVPAVTPDMWVSPGQRLTLHGMEVSPACS